MPGIAVRKGAVAVIEVTNLEIIDAIRGSVEKSNHKPRVEFRRDRSEIALVFNDGGEITIDVSEFMADLQTVDDAGGRFFVYATDPVPANPPPPDTLCPC